MRGNFDASFRQMLRHEGGFVNHPRDPGGMTNLGVTRAVYEQWLGRHVSEAEMRALTPSQVEPLYRERYWKAVRADDLPPGLDYAVFDCAVNSGPGRAARLAQKLVGATQDGAVGPKTLAKIEAIAERDGLASLIEDYCDERLAFLQSLSHWATFGRGWTKRVNEVRNTALDMAREEVR